MIDQSIQTYICEIKKKLKDFAACCKTQKKLVDARDNNIWHSNYWTNGVVRRIGCIGIKHGFEVYSESHRHNFSKHKGWYRTNKGEVDNDKGEWSYDLCWVKEHDELTESLPLTLECEWEPARFEIEFDFEKLLRSSAALRVMIFERWGPSTPADTVKNRARKEIKNLIHRIEAFSGCQSEAKYLFCVHCTYKNGNKFIFRCYPDEGK